jgi:hypothetical protein
MKKEDIFLTNGSLEEFLRGELPEQRCTITTKSAPKANKKSRITKELFENVFDKGIICQSTRDVLIGVSYKEMLSRYPKEGEQDQVLITEESKLPWGEWVEGSNSLIVNKDEYYLRVYQVEKGSMKLYIDKYGNTIGDEKVLRLNEFLPPEKEDSDKKFIVNMIKLSSIEKIEFEDRIFVRG